MSQHGIATLTHISNGGFDSLVRAIDMCVSLKNLCAGELAEQMAWTVEDYKAAGLSDNVAEAAFRGKEGVAAACATITSLEETWPPNAV